MATRVKLKTEKINKEREKRPHASANHIRISPTKVRVVLDIVRGKPVNNALAILSNTPKSASEPVFRLISSAIANAENNLNMSRDDLYVAEIYASGGPVLKRAMPRAKGRSVRILKRTSHITVILDEINNSSADRKELTTKNVAKAANKGTANKVKKSVAKSTESKTKQSVAKADKLETQKDKKTIAEKQKDKPTEQIKKTDKVSSDKKVESNKPKVETKNTDKTKVAKEKVETNESKPKVEKVSGKGEQK